VNKPTPQEIKLLRKEFKLTQSKFAELSYKDLRTVQRWEAGKINIPLIVWEFYLVYFNKLQPRIKL